MAWPMTPPVITPIKFSRADKIIVVICDRSPHSATNVMVNACMKIRSKTLKAPAFAFFTPPTSGSAVILLLVSLFTYFKMEKMYKNKSISIRRACDVIELTNFSFSPRNIFFLAKEKKTKRNQNGKKSKAYTSDPESVWATSVECSPQPTDDESIIKMWKWPLIDFTSRKSNELNA